MDITGYTMEVLTSYNYLQTKIDVNDDYFKECIHDILEIFDNNIDNITSDDIIIEYILHYAIMDYQCIDDLVNIINDKKIGHYRLWHEFKCIYSDAHNLSYDKVECILNGLGVDTQKINS